MSILPKLPQYLVDPANTDIGRINLTIISTSEFIGADCPNVIPFKTISNIPEPANPHKS